MRKPEDIIETNFTKVYNEIHTKAKRIAFQRATKHANQLLLNRDLLELTGKKPEPESAISVVIVDDEYTLPKVVRTTQKRLNEIDLRGCHGFRFTADCSSELDDFWGYDDHRNCLCGRLGGDCDCGWCASRWVTRVVSRP